MLIQNSSIISSLCGNSHTDAKDSNDFLSFGFNTKIQRYHTSPSQIWSFTLEPKLKEREEKREGGHRSSKINSRCSYFYLPSWATGFNAELRPLEEPFALETSPLKTYLRLTSTLTDRHPVYMQIKPFLTVTTATTQVTLPGGSV